MAISSNLRGYSNQLTFNLGLYGALLFVVSDSLLAYNSFVEPFLGANIFIMTTYALAQLFIVKSIIRISGNSAH